VFWAVVGSGLSLRRGSDGWRFDCPRDPAHTVTMCYRKVDGKADGVVYLHCHHDEPYTDGCSALAVLTALGCSFRDLYHQAAADGACVRCGTQGYRVQGVLGNRAVCLAHLLEATHQPLGLLFEK